MINQYKSWKLLYEDDNQCFSKAIEIETENDVLVITHFEPNRIKKSVKTIVADLLNHFLEAFEDENGYHIVLKYLKGTSVKAYFKRNPLSYENRVQLCYDWIKTIVKYDQFPDALKIQLIDYEQLIVQEDVLTSREWIDFSATEDIDHIKMFKQMGQTLEVLLPDAPLYQSQFIDTLKIGKHDILSLTLFRKAFKDIFLFEKEEAVKQIPFEYDIILNDVNAGPPIKVVSKPHTELVKTKPLEATPVERAAYQSPKPEPQTPSPNAESQKIEDTTQAVPKPQTTTKSPSSQNDVSSVSNEIKVMKIEDDAFVDDEPVGPHLPIDDVHELNPLSEYLTQQMQPEAESSEGQEDAQEEYTQELSMAKDDLDVIVKATTLAHQEDNADEEQIKVPNTPITEADVLREVVNASKQTEEPLKPKDYAKYWLDDDNEIDQYAKEMDELFNDDLIHEKKWKIGNKETLIIAAVSVLILISLLYFGLKTLSSDEPIAAKFTIEKQETPNQLPLSNDSTGGSNIDAYLWEIYYKDVLAKTYNDKNLILSLDTPGAYRIILKVKDKEGNWSEPYEQTYHYIP